MLVSKKVSFDAAHYLPDYKGKCHNLHGHHWVVEVGLEGPVDSTGMVVDFTWIKKVLETQAVKKFDHKLVNDILPNPTAENIAVYLYDKIDQEWCQGPTGNARLAYVRVWETEDSMAEYRG
jgi:6-pyruvoyltetrahydropterin/6-carboxytetrahydropterin synthase